MENIIYQITNCFWKSRTTKVSHNHSKSPITQPLLSRIQRIIQAIGNQKASLLTKLKVTMQPIGTFLWKHFFCRLCNVLKTTGLFSFYKKKLTFKELVPFSKIDNPACETFPLPYQKEKKLPIKLPSIIEEPEPLDYITKTFSIVVKTAETETVPKAFKGLVPFPKIDNPACETFPLPYQKEKKLPIKLPSIIEEPILSILLEKAEVTKEEFFNAASEVFGRTLIERIQSWKKVSLPEILQKNDLLHALAIIGHGITLSDLTQLLIRVNKGEVFLELSSKENDIFKLSTQDIKKLVDFFRNPLEHLLPGEKEILWKELEASKHPIDSKRVAYTKYEYHIYKLAEEANLLTTEEEKELLPFAASEQIAKFVGYAKPDTICKDMIIPIFNIKYGIVYYQLNDYINNNGLHCYLFTPLNKDLSVPAQLVFRGTDGIESAKRDILDSKGIGKTVFDESKEKIAIMINSYCKSTSTPALEISGHSLGGIDAQRATVLCLKLFNDEPKQFTSRLSYISCFAFCSPKLDAPTIDLGETEIKKLKNSPLKIKFHFAYHTKDIITWLGYKNLSIPEDLTMNANLQAAYIQVNSNSGITTGIHHRTPFFTGAKFDSSIDGREYIFYTNTEHNKLQAKLAELKALQLNEQKKLFDELSDNKNELFSIVNSEELEIYEQDRKKEKVKNYQIGYSPTDSWLFSILWGALSPMQATVSYLTKTR